MRARGFGTPAWYPGSPSRKRLVPQFSRAEGAQYLGSPSRKCPVSRLSEPNQRVPWSDEPRRGGATRRRHPHTFVLATCRRPTQRRNPSWKAEIRQFQTDAHHAKIARNQVFFGDLQVISGELQPVSGDPPLYPAISPLYLAICKLHFACYTSYRATSPLNRATYETSIA